MLKSGSPDQPRTRKEASAYLWERHHIKCSPQTLARKACAGGGPPMQYFGRYPYYPVDGLDQWAAARTSPRVNSTAELRKVRSQGVAA
jgi:hypothetical protein